MKRAIVAAVIALACLACGGPEAGGADATAAEPQDATTPDLSCVASGGTIRSSLCCPSVNAFPNTCLVGGCGCAPAYSHPVPVCACPAGKCFDGARCVTDPRLLELQCRQSGGTVVTSLCCTSVGDFPSACVPGACGCAPAYSHPARTCQCPAGKCFDGARCVLR